MKHTIRSVFVVLAVALGGNMHGQASTGATAGSSLPVTPPNSGGTAETIVPAPNEVRIQRNGDGTYGVVGAAQSPAAAAKGKSKKAPVSAGGTWKWTTYNRSLQPCENVLTLVVGKNGKISGKLIDRTGEHEIKDAALGDGVVTFDLKFHTRGVGDLPHTYTVNLDPDNPQVSVDRPDLTPLGKSQGGKHHLDHSAKHDPNG